MNNDDQCRIDSKRFLKQNLLYIFIEILIYRISLGKLLFHAGIIIIIIVYLRIISYEKGGKSM